MLSVNEEEEDIGTKCLDTLSSMLISELFMNCIVKNEIAPHIAIRDRAVLALGLELDLSIIVAGNKLLDRL